MNEIVSLHPDIYDIIFRKYSNQQLLFVSKKIKKIYENYIKNITKNIYNINYINQSRNIKYNEINYVLQYYFGKQEQYMKWNKLYDLLLLLIINNGTTLIYICDYILRYEFISTKLKHKMINNVIVFSILLCLNNSNNSNNSNNFKNIKKNKIILQSLNIIYIKMYIRKNTLLYNYYMTLKFNYIINKYTITIKQP